MTADPGAILLIALNSSQNIILEGVEELAQTSAHVSEIGLWESRESSGGNTRTFTFTPYLKINQVKGNTVQKYCHTTH